MTIPINTPNAPAVAATTAIQNKPQGEGATSEREPAFGKDGFNFFDLLDIINPLQHIPVISTLYRKLTGDEISPASRLAGGGLFGGPIGLGYAMINNIADDATGKDLGEHAMALFMPDKPEQDGDTMLATAEPATNPEADKALEQQPPAPSVAAAAATAAFAAKAEAGQQARAAAVRAGVALGAGIAPGKIPSPPVTASPTAFSPNDAFTVNERLFNYLAHPFPLEAGREQQGTEKDDRDADKAREKDRDKRAAVEPQANPLAASDPWAERTAAYLAGNAAQLAALNAAFKTPNK